MGAPPGVCASHSGLSFLDRQRTSRNQSTDLTDAEILTRNPGLQPQPFVIESILSSSAGLVPLPGVGGRKSLTQGTQFTQNTKFKYVLFFSSPRSPIKVVIDIV